MTKGLFSYLIDVLQADAHIGISENVEIAKGKYHLPSTWAEGKKLIRRQWLKK